MHLDFCEDGTKHQKSIFVWKGMTCFIWVFNAKCYIPGDKYEIKLIFIINLYLGHILRTYIEQGYLLVRKYCYQCIREMLRIEICWWCWTYTNNRIMFDDSSSQLNTYSPSLFFFSYTSRSNLLSFVFFSSSLVIQSIIGWNFCKFVLPERLAATPYHVSWICDVYVSTRVHYNSLHTSWSFIVIKKK